MNENPAKTPDSPFWAPRRHADRRPLLLARNRLQASIRAYFADEDFVEVDPAGLQVSPGNEAHLHGYATERVGTDGTRETLYLHTSPEFAMKKLLAAGEQRIFAFAHVWRNREAGPLHASEFTMLEWYRTGEPYARLMEDCAALLRLAAEAAGATLLRHRDRTCDPFAPLERLSVADAFARYAGIDLGATLSPEGVPDGAALQTQMAANGLHFAPDDTWSDMVSRILVERVEPKLGDGHPVLLDRYPVAEAALARRTADDPRFAERFELYCCGVELANGFGELTDADEQRRRFIAEMDEKERVYGERYPLDEDFLAALARMPEASGIALGFDRLVLLATGAPRIDDVIWAPAPR